MLDLGSTGRLRYLIESILWAGFVVLIAAVGIAEMPRQSRPAAPTQRTAPAEQWLDETPRAPMEAETREVWECIGYLDPS
jgi:hypothetical protein